MGVLIQDSIDILIHEGLTLILAILTNQTKNTLLQQHFNLILIHLVSSTTTFFFLSRLEGTSHEDSLIKTKLLGSSLKHF